MGSLPPTTNHLLPTRIARIAALCLLLVLPLAFWTPLIDCFPLPKLLFLFLFGGTVLAAGWSVLPPSFVWTVPWSAWVALGMATGNGVTSWWRSLPEAGLLVLPPLVAGACSGAGLLPGRRGAAGFAVLASLMSVYAILQALGFEPGSWINPFHKGVASTIGNPDLLGGFLVFPFSLALADWLESPNAKRSAAPILIGVALIATEARAAWLSAFAVIGVLAAVRGARKLAPVALAAALLAAGWLAAHPAALSAFTSGSALRERAWTWQVSAHAVREHPVAGWGVGSFRTVFLARQAVDLVRGGSFHYTEYAHLEPLHFWVETGAVGLGLLAWGIACLFRSMRMRVPGAAAGWVGLLANSALSFPFHVPPTIVPAWLLAAEPANGQKGPPRAFGTVRAVAVLALVIIAAVSFRLFNASAFLRQGQVLALSGHPGEAVLPYANSARLNPGDVRVWWYLAIVDRANYTPSGGLAHAERGLGLEPAWCELHHERGMALKALDRPREAEAAYREALRCNPGFPHSWNNLGNLLGALGRLREAEAAQRRALELNPDSPEARRNLAVTLMRMGKRKEAERIMGSVGSRW